MKIAAIIAQVLVSVGFFMTGVMKLMNYDVMVADPKMAWMLDFSETQIRVIAVLEILGVLGMLLPFIVKKFKALVPISAFCLVLLGSGAVYTHISREEMFLPALILTLLTLFVAFARKDLLKAE